MRLGRRELLGYAVAGTTGVAVTTAAREFRDDAGPASTDSRPRDADQRVGVGQYWRLGGVYARPAEIGDTAVTFRVAASSSYDTDYEVTVRLDYRPKRDGASWRKIAEGSGPLAEGVYLEATETGLETGQTYQYRGQARLTNYAGQSRRVSEVREVTAGRPCSGPSTNCLRVETLPAEVGDSGVTLRGRARGLDSYDAVTGHFFYRREGGEKRWTEYEPIEGKSSGTFSAALSALPAGTYTYYAEARGEGGEMKNMYAEGEKRRFTME